MRITRILNLFWKGSEGIGAVEFALAAPLLAVVLLGLQSGWTSLSEISDMHQGLRAGANYVLQGGTNLDNIKQAALTSWTNRPAVGTVDVVQKCTCSGAAGDCTTLCADSTVPQMSIVLTGTTTLKAPILFMVTPTEVSVSKQEIVRVR